MTNEEKRQAEIAILDGPCPPPSALAEAELVDTDPLLGPALAKLPCEAGSCTETEPCQNCDQRRRYVALLLHRAKNGKYRHPSEVPAADVDGELSPLPEPGETETVQSAADPGAIPSRLLDVPGFISEVMAYTLATAPYPEPVLAFAGALALQSVLCARKVRDTMDNRSNLYILSLANSGVGKEHSRKINTRILSAADCAQVLGTSFASGEGIEDRLLAQRAALFQVDEFDGLLLRIGHAKDARHEQIVSILLQMYSSANSTYVVRAKAGQENRQVINQPCLCLFGCAVPKNFYESLSARLLTNGFLARFIILESGVRGAGQETRETPIPQSILTVAKFWNTLTSNGNLSSENPTCRVVSHTYGASKIFTKSRLQADAAYDQAQAQGDAAAMAIWARAHEKIRRLALLYACSADYERPEIGEDAARWASEFVEYQTRRMLFMSAQHTAESDYDLRRKKLLEILSQWRVQYDTEWMPFWRINRKLPWPAKEHEQIRTTLVEQRLVEITETGRGSRGGKPGLAYRLLYSS